MPGWLIFVSGMLVGMIALVGISAALIASDDHGKRWTAGR